jgi:hypothetical protein
VLPGSGDEQATVTVKVTNSGERTGAEVVQLYVTYPDGVGEPPRVLKGFQKVRPEQSEGAGGTTERCRSEGGGLRGYPCGYCISSCVSA